MGPRINRFSILMGLNFTFYLVAVLVIFFQALNKKKFLIICIGIYFVLKCKTIMQNYHLITSVLTAIRYLF